MFIFRFQGVQFDLQESTTTFGVGDINGGDSFEALPLSMTLLQTKMAEPDINPMEGSRKREQGGRNLNQQTS